MKPDIQTLRQQLSYDPETGFIKWKCNKTRVRIGDIAGHIRKYKDGYRLIRVCRHEFMAHVLAWALYHGEWPNMMIDHINGDTSDNRMCNLRLASKCQNQWNATARRKNTFGAKGVSQRQNGKWTATVRANGISYYLGTFQTFDEADKEARKKREELHGEYASHRAHPNYAARKGDSQ